MKLLLFLLRFRFTNLFLKNRSNKYLPIFINLFIFTISTFYGIIIGGIGNFFIRRNEGNFDTVLFLSGIIFGTTFMSAFFPRYIPFKKIFNFQHPITTIKKSWLHIIYYMTRPFNFYLIWTLLCAGSISDNFVITDFISIFLLLFFVTIFEQLIKLQVLYPKRSLIGIFAIAVFPILFWLSHIFIQSSLFQLLILISIAFLLLLAFIYIYYTSEFLEISFSIKKNKGVNNNYLLFILFNKANSRSIIITGFLFKTICLIVLAFGKNPATSTDFKFMVYPLFASPLIYFTYAFNNLFGFHPQMYLFTGYQESLKKVFKLYISIIGIVVLFDFTFSTVLLYITGFSFRTLLFLIITVLNCVLVGFVSSLFKSKRIIKAFDFESMSGNTSIFSILFLMTLTVTLFYFKTYILLTSSLEITLVFFYIFLYYKYLKVNQSKIYQKIVKTVL